MKNDTQKFHVGDEVEVTNKKLKTYGTKGTVKELGYSPFYPEADGTVRPHNFDATGHDCLVALKSGSTIRLKDANIKVVKKNPVTVSNTVELNNYYNVTYRHGNIEQVYISDCDFNNNADGPYVVAMCLNSVPSIVYCLITVSDVEMQKITNKGMLERLEERRDFIEKSSMNFTVVVENRKISSFTDRANMSTDPYFHERTFYDRRSFDAMHQTNRDDSFKELRSQYDTSFTVRGDRLDGLIRELILEKGVSQEHIKVYKLQSPQKVDVKVNINIG